MYRWFKLSHIAGSQWICIVFEPGPSNTAAEHHLFNMGKHHHIYLYKISLAQVRGVPLQVDVLEPCHWVFQYSSELKGLSQTLPEKLTNKKRVIILTVGIVIYRDFN